MKTYSLLAGLLALGLGPALAQDKAEPAPPPATPPEVPATPTPPPLGWKNAGDKKQGEKLAVEFGLPEQAVYELRAKGLGWGEVRHALGIAQKSGQPLSEVLKLRDSGLGWGKIAEHYGFKLGDLARPEEKAKDKEAAEKKGERGAAKAAEHKPSAPARPPSGGRGPKR